MNIFKKGQIGIFVIVAIIIVIGGVLLFSFSSKDINLFLDKKGTYQVKEFIDSCLYSKSNQAVDLLGIKGGWLYHPEMLFANREQPDVLNRRAQGMNFFNVDIPYWFYYDESSQNFLINIPDYDTNNQYSMKSQMKRYIEETIIDECFLEFESFQDRYEFEYERDKLKIDLFFTDNQISITLNFPIFIKEKNSENQDFYQVFTTEVDNKLYVPYHLAVDIVYGQMNSFFLEKRMLNFLTPYQSSNGRDLLPPFYDFKMEFDFEPWEVDKVKDLTKNIFASHMPEIKFLQTSVDETSQLPKELQSSEFARGIERLYTKDYISEHSVIQKENPRLFNRFQDYSVKPTYYQFFPTYFNLAPSAGNVLLLPRPEAVINILPFFFTEYVAVYEITAPILIEIRNDKSQNLADQRFVFNLLIETNIDFNSPLGETKNFNFDEILLDSIQTGQSLVCDPTHFISEVVSLNISDPIDFGNRELRGPKVGVEDAIITFNCGGITSSCFIGQTRRNGEYIQNNITQLNLRLPINCPNGVLEVYKYGHEKLVIENLNPQIDTPINLGEFEMASQKEIDLEVKVISSSGQLFSTGRALNQYESSFLIFTDLNDEENTQVFDITRENQYDLKLKLRPGNYSIEGFIIYNNSLNIPSQQFCYKTGLFSGSDCQTIPGMDLDVWISGGIEYVGFEVSATKLLQEEKLVISMLDFGVPRSYDDLSSMSEIMGDLKVSSSAITPYFDD